MQKEAAFNNIFESAKMSKRIISRATTCKYLRKNKKKVEELENEYAAVMNCKKK